MSELTKMLTFEVNDLVTSPRFEGIGCVAKVLKTQVVVNYGPYGSMKVSPGQLTRVDTSFCKTVSMERYKRRLLMAHREDDNFNYCILGNELLHFVGIGWHTMGVVTTEDLKKYPRVIH
jgi:hypothetical protein